MNHLSNHLDNLLPNDFILTLDTHFVSSMILLKKYDEALVRVVRKSDPGEYGHQKFSDRLGYIYVYSGHVDPIDDDTSSTPEERRRLFLDTARTPEEHSHLPRGDQYRDGEFALGVREKGIIDLGVRSTRASWKAAGLIWGHRRNRRVSKPVFVRSVA